MTGTVVVGGGQAALQVAASLRQGGYEAPIVLVSEEERLPYQRPPLSKAYLKDGTPFEHLLLRPESFYHANRIDLCLGKRVAAIDRAAREVELVRGARLAYDRLVLATGARNRVPPIPGMDLPGVHLLRRAEDAEALRETLSQSSHLAVIGGGFIGLEVAAVVRGLGLAVTVLEAASRLMGRVISPAVSDFFFEAHRAMGTEVLLNAKVRGITNQGGSKAVELEGGARVACDAVLVAAGVLPNDEIAKAAGLTTAGGVAVDRFMTTDDPSIFAIGDCAVFESRYAEGPIRLESVQNAVDQAKSVAARILGGDSPYDSVPWFWSDQGSYKLQMVGITAGADHVSCIGSPEEHRFIAYCFRGEHLLGIETINRPGEHMTGRKVLAQKLKIARAEVERSDFDLKTHVSALAAR